MADVAELKISVDASEAVASVERLREALEGVNAELEKLAGNPHGGISFKMVGQVASCEVKPPVQ